MHELSVAGAVLTSLEEYVAKNGGEIRKISLTLGRLGGVDPEALRFAWPMALAASGNKALEHCELEIELLPLSFLCRSCGGTCEAEKLLLNCPACGTESLVRNGGRELLIKSIEVERNV